MTQYVIANNVNTQLASAISSASTTIALSSAANLPTLSAGQIMPLTLNDASTGLNYEIVYVTAISGSSLTVTRAQEGTSALNWNVGDYAYCAFTAGTVATALGNPNDTFAVAPATASNQAVNLGQFGSSLATSGYQKLPSGLIIQWGANSVSGASGSQANYTYPLAFPSGAFMVTGSIGSSQGNNTLGFQPGSPNKTTFTVGLYNGAGASGSSLYFSWIAMGY